MAFYNEFPGNRFYDGDLGWLLRKMRWVLDRVGKTLLIKDDDDQVIIQAPDDHGGVHINKLYLDSFSGDPDLNVDEVGAELDRLYFNRHYGAIHVRNNAGGVTGLTARFVQHQGAVTVEFKTSDEGLVSELATAGSYITLQAPVMMRPRYNLESYQLIGARFTAQVNIMSDGTIQIGYSRHIADGTVANIPAGTMLRFNVTYVTAYDTVFLDVDG